MGKVNCISLYVVDYITKVNWLKHLVFAFLADPDENIEANNSDKIYHSYSDTETLGDLVG